MIGLSIELSETTHSPNGGHPENVRRLLPTVEWLRRQEADKRYRSIPVTSHGMEPLHRIHSQSYLDFLQHACLSELGHLDPDTYVTPNSFQAANQVTDTVLSAVDKVMSGELQSAFLLVRPPGHHAEHDRAMGFCLLNNVAIAAQYLRDNYGIEKVAVVDFDVHHGNGTQHLFYDRADIFFASIHQFPFYPGTGAKTEIGLGEGRGYTLNIPLSAGAGDPEFLAGLDKQILPAIQDFRPDFLLISAGFDAHMQDPIGGLNVTGDGFRLAGQLIAELAQANCSGRMISVLEGGYSAEGNLDAVSKYVDGLDKV